jgi:hypothetical protein
MTFDAHEFNSRLWTGAHQLRANSQLRSSDFYPRNKATHTGKACGTPSQPSLLAWASSSGEGHD